MPRNRYLLLWIVSVVLLWTGALHGMTLTPAPLQDLLVEADLVVHGVVIQEHSEGVPGRPELLRTRYQLWVLEHLKAPTPGTAAVSETLGWLEFVQPGGSSDRLTVSVPGVPRFKTGDEVVLLLARTPWGLQPLGYPMGTFFVGSDGVISPAWSGHSSRDVLDAFSHDFRPRFVPQPSHGIAP